MVTCVRPGIRLHWEEAGDTEGQPLLLLNSIGTDLHLWDRVMPYLADFRVLRMDTRGHGRSEAPRGDYSIDMLVDDVIAVLDDAGVARTAVAGVSLGGMMAMGLALDYPDRVEALIPICTSATMDPGAWTARVQAVRYGGTEAILDLALGRFLSPEFRKADPDASDHIAEGLRRMSNDGYAGCAAAIRDMDIYWRLREIEAPTLVVAGDLDTSTPFEGHGQHIAEAIPRAQTVHLHAAHLAPLEAPEALATTLIRFLNSCNTTAPESVSERLPSASSTIGDAL